MTISSFCYHWAISSSIFYFILSNFDDKNWFFSPKCKFSSTCLEKENLEFKLALLHLKIDFVVNTCFIFGVQKYFMALSHSSIYFTDYKQAAHNQMDQLLPIEFHANICHCLPPDRAWHKVNDLKVDYSGGLGKEKVGQEPKLKPCWIMMQLALPKVAQLKPGASSLPLSSISVRCGCQTLRKKASAQRSMPNYSIFNFCHI